MAKDPFGLLRAQKPGVIGYLDASGTWRALNPGANNTVLNIASGFPAWNASPSLTNLIFTGWGRGGSATTPSVTTAGYLTLEGLVIPDQSAAQGLVSLYTDASNVRPLVVRMDANSGLAAMRVQGAAVIPRIEGIRSQGTTASPSAVLSGGNLLRLTGGGYYDGSNVVLDRAYFALRAVENWSSTNQGTYATLALVPAASTSVNDYYYWDTDGFRSTGYVAAGSFAAPTTAGAGRLIGTDGVYPEDDANFHIKFSGSDPRYTHDTNDYYDYSRSGNQHRFYVSSTEMLRVGATAIEYKSFSARATNSGAGTQSISTGTTTAVTFNAEAYDTGAIHSTASNTSRLTAPVTGRYHVTGGILWAASVVDAATLLLTRISKNGTVIEGSRSYFPPISSIGTNGQGQTVSCDIDLAATDYVELEVFHDSTGSRNLTLDSCSFQMHYIGGL